MNCRNCGAAMTLVAGRDYFRCDYCVSFHFPDGTGDDGVRVVGGPTQLACPICREALREGRAEGEPVQFCSGCRGFLATNPAFSGIVRGRRARRPVGDSPHAFDPTELRRAVSCPACDRRMDTHPYYGGGRVVVDTCPKCCLIWLDAGELAVIERHNPPRLVTDPPPAAPPTESDDVLAGWRIVPW
jgi:Zn-finger nucleic acid-binding protein